MTDVTLPDAEAMVVSFLTFWLGEKVTVSTRPPNPLPDFHVRVRRTGGRAPNRILDDAQITLEAYGPDTVTASNLAREAQHCLHRALRMGGIALARGPVTTVGGPYYDPDPVSGRERYTFTIRVLLRGTTTP